MRNKQPSNRTAAVLESRYVSHDNNYNTGPRDCATPKATTDLNHESRIINCKHQNPNRYDNHSQIKDLPSLGASPKSCSTSQLNEWPISSVRRQENSDENHNSEEDLNYYSLNSIKIKFDIADNDSIDDSE